MTRACDTMAGMSYSRQPHARSDSGRVRNRNRILSEKNAEIAGMTVHIIRKPIKNMYLRIKPPNADVEISAPQRMSADTIERFVIERRSWIERARQKMLLAREMEIRRGKALSEQRGLSDGNPGGPLTFVWNDENKAQARHNIDARLPALLAIWGADYRSRAYTYHFAYHDIPLGLMHAPNRSYPAESAARPDESEIFGIRTGT